MTSLRLSSRHALECSRMFQSDLLKLLEGSRTTLGAGIDYHRTISWHGMIHFLFHPYPSSRFHSNDSSTIHLEMMSFPSSILFQKQGRFWDYLLLIFRSNCMHSSTFVTVVLFLFTQTIGKHVFGEGEYLNIKVNGLRSSKTLIPYDYYSLPFPKVSFVDLYNVQPKQVIPRDTNLGEMLAANSIKNSLYDVQLGTNRTCMRTSALFPFILQV